MLQDSLKNIIQPGDTIYTRCSAYDEWVPNVINNIDDNTISINLTEYYFRKGVMVGDFISVRYSHSDKEYVLEGEITDIDIYNTYTITIFINNVNIYKERRKHFRFYAKLGASLKRFPSEKGTYSIITNISLSGIALISKVNIGIGKYIYIDLFQSSKDIIQISGVIIRKKALNYGYEYGIAIKDIDSATQEKIEKLINKLENEYFRKSFI